MKKGYFFLYIFCMCVVTLTSCGIEKKGNLTEDKIQWKKQNRVTDAANWMSDTAECMCTEYEGVSYCFDVESFQQKQAEKFIKDAAKLIQYAETIVPRKSSVGDIFIDIPIHKEKIEVEKVRTFDSLWQVVERVCQVNAAEQYGLFYWYSVKQKLINEDKSISQEKVRDYFDDKNLFLLDFCLPMVETTFFEEEQAKMTQAAAIDFAEWFEKTYSEKGYKKLCKNIAVVKRRELEDYKNKWLKAIGSDKTYKEEAKLLFQRTNEKARFGDRNSQPITIYGCYETDCEDVLWIWNKESVREEGFREMVKEYQKVESLRKQDFADAKDFLKRYLPEELSKVKIYFNYSEKQDRAGAKMLNGNQIVLNYDWFTSLQALLHEYCHVLTIGKDKLIPSSDGIWMEGVAEWLAVFQLKNRLFHLAAEQVKEERIAAHHWKDGDEKQLDIKYLYYKYFLEDVENEASRDLSKDMKGDEGFPFYIMQTRMSYMERAAVINYIYKTYGIEKLAELTRGDMDFKKVLGKSLEEIYFEAADYSRVEFEKILENFIFI